MSEHENRTQERPGPTVAGPIGTLAYFDPHIIGHRKEHLAFYLRACERSQVRLRAYVPKLLWEDACLLAQCELRYAEHARDLEVSKNKFREKCFGLNQFLSEADQSTDTLLYLPMIDEYLLPLLYLRATRGTLKNSWSGVFFRDSFNYFADDAYRPLQLLKSIARWMLLSLAVRTEIDELLTLNEVWKRKPHIPVTWLPDALSSVDSTAAAAIATTTWPLPHPSHDRVCLLMFGAMEPRKGIAELLDALSDLDEALLAKTELRLLGRFAPGLRQIVEVKGQELTRRGAIVEIADSYISERDLHAALCKADFVLAPYVNHIGSSGVVGLAARYGRPVLAQSSYQIGDEVRRWRLGLAVNCRDRLALGQALVRLLDGRVIVNEDMRRYTETRNPQAAEQAFDAFLSRRFHAAVVACEGKAVRTPR